MPFQNAVNLFNPLAVAGDFASTNPRATVLAGEGALVAGPNGVTVGQFAWVSAVDGRTVNNFPIGPNDLFGFVHRDQQALITKYLAEASNVIPPGFPVTLFDAGDFWDLVAGSTPATVGAACFASFADGSLSIGAAPAGPTATGSVGSTFTATGSGTNLTTSAVTGLISPGDTISGAGVPAGTTIISQTSGTPGGAGVYVTSQATTVAAGTVTSFGNVLDVTAVAGGNLAVGDAITGANIPAGVTIVSQTSGATGGVGVYILSAPATQFVASEALTVVTGVQTKFFAKTAGAVGQLVKISTWGN